jgi:hypothetical protein
MPLAPPSLTRLRLFLQPHGFETSLAQQLNVAVGPLAHALQALHTGGALGPPVLTRARTFVYSSSAPGVSSLQTPTTLKNGCTAV